VEDRFFPLPATPRSQEIQRPTGTPGLLTPRNLRMVAEVLQVGLSLLEGNGKARPLARALRIATAFGAAAVNDEGDLLERIREMRGRMKALEEERMLTREDKRRLRQMQDQLLVLLDLFLERG